MVAVKRAADAARAAAEINLIFTINTVADDESDQNLIQAKRSEKILNSRKHPLANQGKSVKNGQK